MTEYVIETARVGLRPFKAEDLDAFSALNDDPDVMEFFPRRLSRLECEQYMQRINEKIEAQGYGFWAAEHLLDRQFMGFVGITQVSYETLFTPAVEIGWRLATRYWGRGLATEAARACLVFGFEKAKLDRIVSFTSLVNRRSFRVMERLGMTRQGEFDHPEIPDKHVLKRHVWYALDRSGHFYG